MGWFWVCRKSQKISTASDQYFLSYVKKTTGGGQIDPPPSRNRVKEREGRGKRRKEGGRGHGEGEGEREKERKVKGKREDIKK